MLGYNISMNTLSWMIKVFNNLFVHNYIIILVTVLLVPSVNHAYYNPIVENSSHDLPAVLVRTNSTSTPSQATQLRSSSATSIANVEQKSRIIIFGVKFQEHEKNTKRAEQQTIINSINNLFATEAVSRILNEHADVSLSVTKLFTKSLEAELTLTGEVNEVDFLYQKLIQELSLSDDLTFVGPNTKLQTI